MKLRKYLVLLSLVTVLAVSVSASSFGSFASEDTKTIRDGDASFEIGVFNLGNEPLELQVSSTVLKGGSGIRMVHDDSIVIEPSEVTENPSGDGNWFLLDGERYVKVRKIPVRAFVDRERSTSDFEFRVDMKASPAEGNSGGDIVQTLSQVRSYRFTVKARSPSTNPQTPESGRSTTDSALNPETQPVGITQSVQQGISSAGSALQGAAGGLLGGNSQESSGQDQNVTVEQDSDQEDSSEDYDIVRSEDGEESTEESSKPASRTTGEFFQSIGANYMTFILMIAFMMSTVYLFRVIGFV